MAHDPTLAKGLSGTGRRPWLLALEAQLIRFSASPVGFIAALLLLGLLGLVLFQSLWGALLCLLAPLVWLLGILLLRRRHLLQRSGLRAALEQKALAACNPESGEEHFTLTRAVGSLPIPLVRRLYTGLTTTVIVPHPTWVALATVEGDVLPPTWWRQEDYLTSVCQCTEVYLREVSHVSVDHGRLVLHTSGGERIEVPADERGEPERAMDHLRRSLRRLAESDRKHGGEHGAGPDSDSGPDPAPDEAP